MNIILIGMMGSGKTTIGKILAKELNLNFVDTDQEIEKKYLLSITAIFEQYSEETFRQYEQLVIENYCKKNNL